MLDGYIRIAGIIIGLISVVYVVMLILQLRITGKKDREGIYRYFRIQTVMILSIHLLASIILLNYYHFSQEILLLFIGQLMLLFVVNFVIEHFFLHSQLPLWSISQYLLVISFIIISRLDLDLGIKHFYMASAAYLVVFLMAYLYRHFNFFKYLGILAVGLAIALLLMANTSVGGANNWLTIGNFVFQPSEPVKILYILFLASTFTLLTNDRFKGVIASGIFAVTLAFIQVFQNDLGSALIYYVVFILMCYVYTTNRLYIIAGGAVTFVAGYFAWLQLSHVQVRLIAWLNPWSELYIDNQGYQITQSLFAIGNGGITGAGLTLGNPEKIPVVTTDFIYSAIYEELGMLVGIAIILVIVMFCLFTIQMLNKAKEDFDFLFGSGLMIVYAFQSFLIIGGVTRAVPLTGVTLPFVSYGGSSLITTFVLLGMLEGIALKNGMDGEKAKASKKSKNLVDLGLRNKPLKRVRLLFIVMFAGLTANILYFAIVQAETLVINDFNPRLEAMEASVIRGDIVDRNGLRLAYSTVSEGKQERVYPFDGVYAHTIGYTGIGKIGLEAYNNLDLIRSRNHLTDQVLEIFEKDMPKANSVITTLDGGLQALAYEQLGDNKGAVIAMDPKTGQVLAMVSKPDFDPNAIQTDFDLLIQDEDNASLLNRATQGLYPPGSTYKAITAIAWLEEHLESDFFHYCEGEIFIGQKVIHCYDSKAHGRISLEEAFAKSCNTAFAKLGNELDRDRLQGISSQFMYNQEIPFELEVSTSSFVLNSDSSPNDVVETVIGQGETLVTPLNNVMIACAIANDGLVKKPYIVDRIVSSKGEVIEQTLPEDYREVMTSDMAQTLGRYMITASEPGGTAGGLTTDTYSVASKTGTAEHNPEEKDHAWYIGYAPADNPQIAIAIIVEKVGPSSQFAVPIAEALYQYYLTD